MGESRQSSLHPLTIKQWMNSLTGRQPSVEQDPQWRVDLGSNSDAATNLLCDFRELRALVSSSCKNKDHKTSLGHFTGLL